MSGRFDFLFFFASSSCACYVLVVVFYYSVERFLVSVSFWNRLGSWEVGNGYCVFSGFRGVDLIRRVCGLGRRFTCGRG